ncbi:hypothetical protein QJS10_CPB17g02024 [Acorus calamus]|uniref:Uncharacterized protein n=1 Tax=Acorus calamus TaxID=4465 RepID=A0AAV9CRR5_ACOCL|nr:hypothetical protein QJS10_CPB17g02024 [Acorus calamus]
MQQNIRRQVSKLKEEWDDSTVSSNISKLRLQNRLEAMTRRERALAYAFSQQVMNHSGGTEKEKREKQMQPRCMEEEIKCKDASDKPSDSDSPHL